MPSLKKRPDSPYWVACYTSADGTRKQVSTKTANKTLALKMCLEFEEAEQKARQGVLVEEQARRVIAKIYESATGQPLQSETTEEWLHHWIKIKTDARAKRTSEKYAPIVEDFLEHLGSRARLKLPHISSKDIQSFRDAQRAKGNGPKTCNLAVKTISIAFNAALRQHKITSNPCTALDPLVEPTATKEPFSTEQVRALLAAADEEWRGVILLAYYTGARLSDVANMPVSALDFKNDTLTYTASKTKKQIKIPLHPALRRALLGVDEKEKFLFPNLEGRRTGGAHGLSKRFENIMTKAGITQDEARPRNGSGRAVSKLSFHSFRHTFNSEMANRGASQETRTKLTGHASNKMNDIYTHLELKPLREAVKLLPDVAP